MTSTLYRDQHILEPDANGRLILKEAKTNIFGVMLIIFAICGIALLSAVYWYQLLFSGTLPTGLSVTQIKFGAGLGIASPLALPYCIKWLKNPPSLIIDNQGIELRKSGQTKRIAWQNVREIKTDVIRDTSVNPVLGSRGFDPYTVTIVKGEFESIVLRSDFGITATTLTAYLVQRQNGASGSHIKLADTNAFAAEKVETRRRLLNRFQLAVFLIVLLAIVAFLLFLLWARLTLF